MNRNVRNMCFTALMAAVMCVVAPLSVPIGPIPISLATLVVYLAGALLGGKKGTLAVAIYILIGAVGVPVFSGYSGGVAKLLGVTGGYIVGYLPCAAIVGFGIDRFGGNSVSVAGKRFPWAYPVAMIVGTIVLYALGTAWFMAQSGNPLMGSLSMCVIPFLPGDAAKIVVATVLGGILRKRLCEMGILKN